MLDENLPVFFYKRAPDGTRHHEAILQSYQGSDPTPHYILKHADPKDEASRNCYAAAIFDSYNTDVLFGEVLVHPTWTKPTLSQDEIRRNGGIPPPPQAIVPGEFTIQLYEPDQQVLVRRKIGGLATSTTYEFELPQTSFRTPSVSALDRTRDDPAATITTPKLQFVWRKEGKISKDYTCYMTGKSTDTATKKSRKDPDIAIALFRSLREITVYEPNLSRVELEDLKGLELVLLLSAATIRDIYISNNLREIFNIHEPPVRKLSSGGRKLAPVQGQVPSQPPPSQCRPTVVNPSLQAQQGPPRPSPSLTPSAPSAPSRSKIPTSSPAVPGKDPRQQWEIDAETARLKAQVAAEEKENARRAAQRRRDQEKINEAETKRLRKMVEAEQREAQRKQKAIDEETQKLRRKYGSGQPALPVRNSTPSASNTGAKVKPPVPRPIQRPSTNTGGGGLFGGSSSRPTPIGRPQLPTMSGGLAGRPGHGGGMYSHPSTSACVMSRANLAPPAGPSQPSPLSMRARRSFWGIKELEEEMRNLGKKRSSIW